MTFPEMIHGKKPEVAPFEPTDPIEELMKLLSGEITDWPQIQKLGDLFQSDVFQKMSQAGLDLKSLITAGGANAQQTLTNALQLQKGIMPQLDVASNLRGSAFQNLGSGLLGSFAGTANSLRNLGVGALDAIQKGAGLASDAGNAVQRWMGISQGTMLPASSQLYSPEWFSQFMAQQRAAKQATQQMRNNVAAAPDPVISGISGTIMNLVGAYLGAGRGGGGGNMLQTSDPNGMANAATINAGGTATYQAPNRGLFQGQQYTDIGPLQDVSYDNSLAPGGSTFGGAGAGSNYAPVPGAVAPPEGAVNYNQYRQYFDQFNQQPVPGG